MTTLRSLSPRGSVLLLAAGIMLMAGPSPCAWADAAINIRNASGFPVSTTVVGVNFSSTDDAVAVNFRVNYDPTKLKYVSAEAGSATEAADKEVADEEPSNGVVSIVIFGLNDNVIPSGRIVNLLFIIKSTATVGQNLALVGSNQASTDTNAQPIATTISDGAISVTQCTAPDAPTAFHASDGDYGDHVELSWNAANGAATYTVYRNSSNNFATATLLAVTTETEYNDYGAAAATLQSSGGCGSSSTLSFTSHYYWVVANNLCDKSDPVGADSGFRGGSKSIASAITYETVLPQGDIAPEDTLAIRLRADAPIVSVWGYVTATNFEDSAVDWVPVPGTETGDGWVTYRPSGVWFPGELVTMIVGGETTAGDSVGPLSYAFTVQEDVAAKAAASVQQPQYSAFDGKGLLSANEDQSASSLTEATETLLDLPGAVTGTYRIVPDGPYTVPQRVWIPVPGDVSADALSPYYFHGNGAHGAWYPGQNVEGWLAPGSSLVLDLNGTTYYGILVNHGGTVALGLRDAPTLPANASMSPSDQLFAGFPENVLLLALVLAILGLSQIRSNRRRRTLPTN